MRRYALKIEELATEQEGNRIARDIHDSLGHPLPIFNIHLEAALRKQLGTKALQDVRESETVLRSDPLQGRSLRAAIVQIVADFERTTGITPTCTLDLDRPLVGELNFTLYRLVQESLTNICKHTGATEVAIGIQQSEQNIQVMIQDNGKGFQFHHNLLGFGLQGMQERMLAVGGSLKVKTAPRVSYSSRFPLSVSMIQLVLVDDQSLIRHGLRALLKTDAELAVIGEAQNGREAITLVKTPQPDMVGTNESLLFRLSFRV